MARASLKYTQVDRSRNGNLVPVGIATMHILMMLNLFAGLVQCAVVATDPTTRSCAAPSVHLQQNLYGKGLRAASTSKCTDPSECCQKCLSNSTCGAWFAKMGASDSKNGQCNLYDMETAAKLQRGSCPGKSHPKCFSASWVLPPPPVPPAPSPPPPPPAPRPDVVEVSVAAQSSWTVSPYLASMSLVYAWAPDAAYKNGTMAEWARHHHINTARFPAGMASYWNWEEPSGYMGVTSLSSNWTKEQQAPEDEWMSLQEYLDLCHATGMTPLIGVNYNCHNRCNVPANESIARAVRQVQFVVEAGFTGAFWYIGNEDGAPQHAALIAEHARAMKQVDPTLKAIWNDNDLSPIHLTSFLKTAGDVMDGAEFHGKWPYGGSPPHMPAFTFQDYLEEVPLVEHKSKQTWRQKLSDLRATTKALGRPDFLLMNNEYGLGKESVFAGNWSRFDKGLVAIELALEMYSVRHYIANSTISFSAFALGQNPLLTAAILGPERCRCRIGSACASQRPSGLCSAIGPQQPSFCVVTPTLLLTHACIIACCFPWLAFCSRATILRASGTTATAL
jgi:hypothetical protein